jgi:hypothetical protein
LMLAHNIIGQEKNGVTFFSRRQDSIVVPVNYAQLAAHESGGGTNLRPLSIMDTPGFDLPAELTIQYFDPDFYLQRNSQREVVYNPVTPSSSSIDLPLTLTGDDAKTFARRLLWTAYGERNTVTFTLPPSYMEIIESDLVHLELEDGTTLPVRVIDVQRGANFVLEVKAITEQAHTLTATATAEDPVVPPEAPPLQDVNVLYVPMDIPLLAGTEGTHRRMYHAAASLTPGGRWRWAKVYMAESEDGNTEIISNPPGGGPPIINTGIFNFIARLNDEAYMGEVFTTLPATGPSDWWDLDTTLEVAMFNGTLQTKSEAQVLAGANMLYVGNQEDGKGEIIQFCNAELLDSGRYLISKILRGRRDTRDRMAFHTLNFPLQEYVVLLDGPGIESITFDSDYTNVDKYFRATGGGSYADVETVGPVRRSARPSWPFSPTYLRAFRNTSTNDLTFKWLRRSRMYFNILDLESGAPLYEGVERYVIKFYEPDTITVARTLTLTFDGTGLPQCTYTAADQTTDGHTPGTGDRRIEIYQVEPKGNGNTAGVVASATFTVPDDCFTA